MFLDGMQACCCMDTEGEVGGYAGGVYHGKVKFPPEYPYKPPGIRFTHPVFFLLKFMQPSCNTLTCHPRTYHGY